jgi:hypothetical protein
MFLDLNRVSIEEVIGRLRVFEERLKPKEVTDSLGRLMLCEEDWEARRKSRREQENSGGSGSGARGKQRGRGRGRGGSGTSSHDGRDGQNAQAAKPGGKKPPPGYHCQSCGKTGHWTNECHSKKGATHVAQAEEEEHALMYNTADPEVIASPVPCCPRRPPLTPAAPGV